MEKVPVLAGTLDPKTPDSYYYIIAGNGMILCFKWLCIVVVNYQRQHYVLKFNSFGAMQNDAIARPCFVKQ